MVVKTVGSGQASIGLTDSDDIAAAEREGLPVQALPLLPEMLLIPNTIGLVRGASHGGSAQDLSAFLLRQETSALLVESGALEGSSRSELAEPTLAVDWELLLRDLDAVTATLNQVFLR
jgi:ABC-type Fe3+ transport system substrate-binding protein